MLERREWPGNVRGLKNFILQLLARTPDEVVQEKHLADELQTSVAGALDRTPADLTLESAIRSHIERVLRLSDNNQSEAARRLGLPLSTLRSKMKKLDIPCG
jgi:DNA-binding NtrC family response regulator